MLLSDVIGRLQDEAIATEALARLEDVALLAATTARAADAGVSLGGYATWAVRHYADTAPPEEWTQLLGALGRSADPGAVFLKRAFAHALASPE